MPKKKKKKKKLFPSSNLTPFQEMQQYVPKVKFSKFVSPDLQRICAKCFHTGKQNSILLFLINRYKNRKRNL